MKNKKWRIEIWLDFGSGLDTYLTKDIKFDNPVSEDVVRGKAWDMFPTHLLYRGAVVDVKPLD